jgi:hypothetical protein
MNSQQRLADGLFEAAQNIVVYRLIIDAGFH